MDLDDKTLTLLSCDLSNRPRSAAGIAELLTFVEKIESGGNQVVIHFSKLASAIVESFVRAERLCCAALTWDLVTSADHLLLIVSGTTEQVSEIKKWFEPQ